MVERAQIGQYPIERAEKIPHSYLTSYCLKGVGSQNGTFIIDKKLRERVNFIHANLMEDLTRLGSFDVIFLRNVLIYFNLETKKQVIKSLLRQLKRGGYLMVGHSESLNGVSSDVNAVVPSVYCKL